MGEEFSKKVCRSTTVQTNLYSMCTVPGAHDNESTDRARTGITTAMSLLYLNHHIVLLTNKGIREISENRGSSQVQTMCSGRRDGGT